MKQLFAYFFILFATTSAVAQSDRVIGDFQELTVSGNIEVILEKGETGHLYFGRGGFT
ncbi:MAG: hypothetical protein R2795_02135 [Saprospiraceae bacterium]